MLLSCNEVVLLSVYERVTAAADTTHVHFITCTVFNTISPTFSQIMFQHTQAHEDKKLSNVGPRIA